MRRAVIRLKNEFWTVFRVQLKSAFTLGSNNKKRKTATSAVGQILLWIVLMFLFGSYEFMIASALSVFDALYVLPTLVVTASSLLTLFQSVTYTKVLIFLPKDHDMLFSLPIKGTTVVSAKLATLYVLDLVSTMAFLLPCAVCYTVFGGFDLYFLISFFIMSFFVPLIPLLLAAVLSAVVSLIASRFRRAKLVGSLFYILFFIGVMLGSMSLSMNATEDPTQMMETFGSVAARMEKIYPPSKLFSDGVLGSISSALLFVGISLLSFAIVSLVFGKCYAKFHEFFAPRSYRVAYKMQKSSSGVKLALLKKDAKRIIASPGLLVNQGAGLLMALIFAIMFPLQFGGEENGADILVTMLPYLLAMGAAMSCLTNTAISLEGKSFPLLKSLPLSANTILEAKLLLHIAVCFPVLFLCSLISSLVLGFSIGETLITVLLPLLYSYNTGITGLFVNLKKYKFDWQTEMAVAKNSLPVTVTIFGGMFFAMIPLILSSVFYAVNRSPVVIGLLVCAVALVLAVVLTVLLRKKGAALFEKIEY